MQRRVWGSLAAAAALLFGQGTLVAAPAIAAAPLTITADMPAAVPTGHNWGFNDFFPRSLKVPQGATIQFAIEGFHTATLLPKGVKPKADIKINGVAKADPDDSGRNINGTTHSFFNVQGLLPTSFGCGTTATPCNFDGTKVVSSGVSFGPPSGPFVVHVTAAPGNYSFLCRVHPGMTGRLQVVPQGEEGTTASELQAKVKDQIEDDVDAGFAAEQAAHAKTIHHKNGTTTWILTAGTGSPDGHVAILEFLPLHVWIKPGDTIIWKPRAKNEPHTVTFPGELHTDLAPLCEAGTTDTPATPTKIPPGSPLDFTCGGPPVEIEFGGGNGVWHVTSPATVSDSGIIGPTVLRRALGLPRSSILTSWKVSFAGAAKGTYNLICQIHPGMAETITVH